MMKHWIILIPLAMLAFQMISIKNSTNFWERFAFFKIFKKIWNNIAHKPLKS